MATITENKVLGWDGTEQLVASVKTFVTTTVDNTAAVSYNSQTLTEEQKAQARANIGAIADGEGTADLTGYVAQDTEPEDTSVLWVDTSDDSDDGFQEAVNAALAQAKASGEFDGVDGKDGTNGKTPVKGTDYFTEADKTEMVNAVIAALPVYAGEVV